MSKPTKVVLVVGVVLAALMGSCLLCLVAGALAEGQQAGTSTTPATVSGLDGRYGCFQVRSAPGFNGTLQPKWFPVPVPNFRIEGSEWSEANTSGSVSVAGNVLTFHGGSLDGWKGLIGADSKPFIAIGGDDHSAVTDQTGNKWNDFKCYVQND